MTITYDEAHRFDPCASLRVENDRLREENAMHHRWLDRWLEAARAVLQPEGTTEALERLVQIMALTDMLIEHRGKDTFEAALKEVLSKVEQ